MGGWEHEVVVQKILPVDAACKEAVCLAGKNKCPPEDCGGIYGYYRLLEAIANPKHPEHKTLSEWLGEPWNPEAFDLEMINATLSVLEV